MSIHQTIYETLDLSDEEVFKLIGGGNPESVVNRREKVRKFLEENEWDVDKYKAWLRKGVGLPPKKEMIKNLGHAAFSLATEGIKMADDEELEKRLSICYDCEMYIAERARCGKCGCFVKGKAKMLSWHCPIKKW